MCPKERPTGTWWISTALVELIIATIAVTITRLQSPKEGRPTIAAEDRARLRLQQRIRNAFDRAVALSTAGHHRRAAILLAHIAGAEIAIPEDDREKREAPLETQKLALQQ